ncbi:hypothetical protein G6F66_014687 [Rhizopus arrhizus]|nr:hypothetical protein G6F66_014687 [Rhizopus arrhizus]
MEVALPVLAPADSMTSGQTSPSPDRLPASAAGRYPRTRRSASRRWPCAATRPPRTNRRRRTGPGSLRHRPPVRAHGRSGRR